MARTAAGEGESANSSRCAHLTSASTIIGTLHLQSGALIDGRVEGQIMVTGHLMLGSNARISGRIEASSVMVSGRVTGDIKADRIEIRAPATVVGNLRSPILVIEAGVVLDGHCFMEETFSAGP